MSYIFSYSEFNGDISKWNVSKVTDMSWIFADSKFNENIASWNVSNVKYMYRMFFNSSFTGNINNWKLNKGCDTDGNEQNRSFKNLILINKLNQL